MQWGRREGAVSEGQAGSDDVTAHAHALADVLIVALASTRQKAREGVQTTRRSSQRWLKLSAGNPQGEKGMPDAFDEQTFPGCMERNCRIALEKQPFSPPPPAPPPPSPVPCIASLFPSTTVVPTNLFRCEGPGACAGARSLNPEDSGRPWVPRFAATSSRN